jgi:hypothetical protein
LPLDTGDGTRVRDVLDPTKDGHAARLSQSQTIRAAIVTAIDTFDETKNGKGTGTVYVQDLGATKDTPYAGVSLFSTTFSPGNLSVAPGDVLDLHGEYQETNVIGSTPPVVFAKDTFLAQLVKPTATFRFETQQPTPVDIDKVADLADYAKARAWMGMLVRVQNVVIEAAPFTAASGRISIDLPGAPSAKACDAPFPKAASLVNDLFDLGAMPLKKGTKVSVIGVVGFFCNVKLAPRSPADVTIVP